MTAARQEAEPNKMVRFLSEIYENEIEMFQYMVYVFYILVCHTLIRNILIQKILFKIVFKKINSIASSQE